MTSISRDLPTPSHVSIERPAANLTLQTAAFSGIWEGRWDGRLASRLIVERIDASSATVVYEWGDSPYFKKGWGRIHATVTSPGVIHWFTTADMTFTMSKDRKTLAGTYVIPQVTATATMTKVA